MQEKTQQVIKRPNGNKNYFNKDTEDAIVRFQREQNLHSRNNIFIAEIKPAFEKLVENIVNVYHFHIIGDVAAMKSDCVSMLFENIHKFNADRGHKAFSYFNVIAKNWFIQRGKVHKKRTNSDVSIDKDLISILEKTDDTMMVPDRETEAGDLEFFQLLKEEMRTWETKFIKAQERTVLDAVRILLENPELPSIYSKKGIYLYMREMTNLNTKQIVINLAKFKKRYGAFKRKYLAGKV